MIEFPWPDKVLNPNHKCHWSKKAKARAAQKDECYYLAMGKPFTTGDHFPRIGVLLTFYPPDHRARDMDNVLASLKGALDGLALAMGVDDKRFNISMAWGDVDPGKDGYIEVVIV